MKAIVNLRAAGTDTANPTAGTLVGTAEVDGEPQVLSARTADYARPRIFVFVQGTFAFGGSVPAEYVEVVPTAIDIMAPAA
jgi:hypothetical protein